jgi:hypothetical protein
LAGRISPIFDVAGRILIEEISNKPLKFRQELTSFEADGIRRSFDGITKMIFYGRWPHI